MQRIREKLAIIFQKRFLLLLPGLFLLASQQLCLTAEPVDEEISAELKGSISRLQTFEQADGQTYQHDADRQRMIQQMMPNYRAAETGSSTREYKDSAIQKLNQLQLTPSGRQTANQVLEHVSQYRRLPEVRFEIDPETYDYFVGHPDVVVSLWQSLGISAINLQQVQQYQYRMNNTDGTTSDVYYLRRSREANVVYCDGQFKSPFLKNPIQAKGIFCLYAEFEKDVDGAIFVRHYGDVFVSFPNTAIETAARLISPVSNYIADRNFQEISLFMHTMSLTMSRQPGWVQEQARKLKGVQPAQAEQLVQVTMRNYQAEQNRLAARWKEFTEPAM